MNMYEHANWSRVIENIPSTRETMQKTIKHRKDLRSPRPDIMLRRSVNGFLRDTRPHPPRDKLIVKISKSLEDRKSEGFEVDSVVWTTTAATTMSNKFVKSSHMLPKKYYVIYP